MGVLGSPRGLALSIQKRSGPKAPGKELQGDTKTYTDAQVRSCGLLGKDNNDYTIATIFLEHLVCSGVTASDFISILSLKYSMSYNT